MLISHHEMITHESSSLRITCFVTGEQWKQNTYIVKHKQSGNIVIIDPGDDAKLIIDFLKADGGKINRILLTHPHHDHVGAAAEVSEYFVVGCELHRLDVRLLVHAPMYALSFARKKITPVKNFLAFEVLNEHKEQPAVKSIHTPGHTKGSVCYLFEGFLFTGDTLLYKHIGRTDFPGSSSSELIESVDNLLCQINDDVCIFPGHGKAWTIAEAKSWWRENKLNPSTYDSFVKL